MTQTEAIPVVENPLADTKPMLPPAIAVEALTKRFADVLASDNLTLNFNRNEIHAVLGENGAGKSTLVKMLYGYYKPTSGRMTMDGEEVSFHSPADARQRGVGMVFQNFTLIPAMTVLENIALLTQTKGVSIDRAGLTSKIKELSQRYGLDVDPAKYVRDLSIGEQQRAEILKMLASNASILILDEPTSVLTPHEVEALLDVIRRLRSDGYAIILITHKLREVFACADRVSVLRRGAIVGGGTIGEFDQSSLLSLMVGDRAVGPVEREELGASFDAAGISLRDVDFQAEDGRLVLQDVSLDIGCGEIVGIAAVSGNGQAGFGDVMLGTGKVVRGSVLLGGTDVSKMSPAKRLESGLALIPEDPVRDGAVPDMSVRENLMITRAEYEGRGKYVLRPGLIARTAAAVFEKSPFSLPAPKRTMGSLSGGNIQRVVLAREMTDHCKYLLAYYPARGLDAASTRSVHEQLLALRARGCAVLLVSEDLDELMALCDRIAVVYHGRIAGEFGRGEADIMEIGRLMTGGSVAGAVHA
jgi:simple sugar transport system ATP-binding protein